MSYVNKLEALKKRIERSSAFYYSEMGKLEQLEKNREELKAGIDSLSENLDTLNKVNILLKQLSEYARESSRKKIEDIVTGCLRYIFGVDMEFLIEIGEARGRPEAEFFIISREGGALIKTRPQEARGGGVIDIISLALRVAMLQCGGFAGEGPLVLDEPAKHVSEEYIVRAG
jgi:cell division protein FtsB